MSCTSIAETENGETGVLSLSTTFMRQVFSRFGEVILVDGTHKTSRYNYELLAFITMNNFGEGVVVLHSLLEADGDRHMDRAIEHFKRVHPDGLKLLRVIIVDKDMKEKRSKPELGSVSMTQCVEALVASDRWTEKEYKNEMANVMRFTTYCVAEQMEPQYAATLSKSENYKYEVSTDDPDELYASSMPSYNCVPSALTFLCACYSMVLH
ncbi:hypothetical protein C6341_g18888 [Phytophthora cactorum]|nr:hypothetical protein C6341_g18888 [Phytophthora cactorum]